MRLVGALPQPNYEDTYEDPHQILSSTPPTWAGSSFNTSGGGGGLVLVSMRLL